jgi:metal-dependent hydrolase (beta-lactamase superfamily II)
VSGIRISGGGIKLIGREEQKENDLFFTCSLIEYIARKTQNRRAVIVDALGKNSIEKIYNLADVYHSDNIDTVSENFISSASITNGNFDNLSVAKYAAPSHWDIGKVYKQLILGIAREKGLSIIDALFEAYYSFVSDKIDDYNSSFYYDAPQNILNAYLYGKIE